ncbi:MAG: phosphopantetheine-binding protein, partial [Micromonosporaceae bacterium]
DEPDGDRRLVAYAVPEAGTNPHTEDLHRHLSVSLPAHAVPTVVLLDRIPLSPNGKVDLRSLPQPRGRGSVSPASRPPHSTVERAIAQVWREVLGIGSVGLDDNFFDLGGTSLSLVKVQRGLTATVGLVVTIVDLFRYPTVAGLAARLSPASPPAADAAGPQEMERAIARAKRRANSRPVRGARQPREAASRR